jgi:thymidine phosphorylase
MLPREIIARKRDGAELTEAEIGAFVAGLTDGSFSEGQVAAFAMAVFFRGMTLAERVALTRAMTRSGTVLDWSGEALPGPILDKHSTGGVGDTVSHVLGPMIAAAGGYVPMISGRGLGHTGGTLDKFDAIPGYRTQPDEATFRRVVRAAGVAIIGQTADLAPADKRFYAIRDVTATVESIPLITASILSKKIAAGLRGLVLDVKVGSGAFMRREDDARALAESLVTAANAAGVRTTALLTDMDQPLAPVAGNALETAFAIDVLAGRVAAPRFVEVTLALGAEMLVTGGLAPDVATATARLERTLADGTAAERFARMVVGLGGPADILEAPWRHMARAPLVAPVTAERSGVVAAIDTRGVGDAVVAIKGGRAKAADAIDPAVGLTDLLPLGAAVRAGDPLALVHARDDAQVAIATARVRAAYGIGESAAPAALLRGRVAP